MRGARMFHGMVIAGFIVMLAGMAMIIGSLLRWGIVNAPVWLSVTGVVTLVTGLSLLGIGGLLAASKSDANEDVRQALREQHFVVVSVDAWEMRAVVRGPGGCAAPVDLSRDRDNHLLVLQGRETVTPEEVFCA